MPETASVDVVVRANADPLSAGLSRARSQLNAFDASMGKPTASVNKFEQANSKASDAVDGLTSSTQDAQKSLDKYQASLQSCSSANDNHVRSLRGVTAANDNAAQGFHTTGNEILATANHLRTAATVAYLFIPAFRDLVNPILIAGAKQIPAAIGAIAPAAGTAAAAIISRLGPALSIFGKIGAALLIYKTITAVFGAMIDQANAAFEAVAKLNDNLESAAVSGEFFQKQVEAAKKWGISAADITLTLNQFNKATLGGPESELDKRLTKLIELGNFQKNIGVDLYKQAITTEEKYRAMTVLLETAAKSGERLAALDLATKFVSADVLTKLKTNFELLGNILDTSTKIQPPKILDAATINQVNDLQKRLDTAKESLKDAFAPNFLQAGLGLKDAWVGTVELAAGFVNLVGKAFSTIGKLVDYIGQKLRDFGNLPFWNFLAKLSVGFGQSVNEFLAKPGTHTQTLGGVTEPGAGPPLPNWPSQFPTSGKWPVASTTDIDNAKKSLEALMGVQSALNRTERESTVTVEKLRGDRSKLDEETKKDKTTLDQEIERQHRSTALMVADAASVGLGVGARQSLRTALVLLTAAQKEYTNITDKDVETAAKSIAQGKSFKEALDELGITLDQGNEKLSKLVKRGGDAARVFAELKAVGKLQFEIDTATLSESEKAVAQILYERYGKKWKEYTNSAIAQLARLSDAIKFTRQTTVDIQKQVESQRIQTETIGMATGAATAYRTEQEKLSEARIRGTKLTDEQRAAIHKFAVALGVEAQTGAEKAAASTLRFENTLIGLTDTEQLVARQLHDLYGDKWVQYANGAIAQQIRINEALKTTKDLTTTFVTDFAHEFNSQLQNGVKGWQAFEQAGLKALQNLATALEDMAIKNLVAQAFGAASGFNFFGLFGAGVGAAAPGPIGIAGSAEAAASGSIGLTASVARGAVFDRGSVTPFALGGVVARPTLFPMATGAGLMGEAGPEGVMPLKRLPDGRLGVLAENSSGIHVTIGGPQIIIQGDASEKTVGLINTQLRNFTSRQLPQLVIKSVKDAKSRRVKGL